MMMRPKSEYPTAFELQILKILWVHSPLPVSAIRQSLADSGRDIAHTSVITTLNTMVGKKYLQRTKRGKAFFFSPRVNADDVSQRMLGDVVARVFGGSLSAAMLSLFNSTEVDDEDLRELRRLLNQKLKERS